MHVLVGLSITVGINGSTLVDVQALPRWSWLLEPLVVGVVPVMELQSFTVWVLSPLACTSCMSCIFILYMYHCSFATFVVHVLLK